jgi:hypothetical protein
MLNIFKNREEEDPDLFSELLIRILFVKPVYDVELKKPDMPSVVILHVLTSYTIGDLKEKLRVQYNILFESHFIFQFKIFHEEDYIPVECYESLKTLTDDDFYRPRLILCIDLNFPFSPESVSAKRKDTDYDDAFELESRGSFKSRATTVGSTVGGFAFGETSQPIEMLENQFHEEKEFLGDDFNLEEELKNLQCEQYSSALAEAGYYQEVKDILFTFSERIC